jgi:hypothetical protein
VNFMKAVRIFLLAVLLALGAALPVVSALTTPNAQPSHPAILRIADGSGATPTPTPTPDPSSGPCPSQGC